VQNIDKIVINMGIDAVLSMFFCNFAPLLKHAYQLAKYKKHTLPLLSS